MSLPPRAVTSARLALRDTLSDLAPGSTIAVACSGGADSLAVACELVFVARKEGWRTAALLVDHGMQDGSAEVTHNAARTCERLGVDIIRTARIDVATGNGSGGPEAAARTGRYAALTNMAEEIGAAAVLLGHTIDDQAETVLLGLARGSGTKSLAGMRPQIGLFRRPFLGLSRADTEAICANAKLDFWVDPTNLHAHGGPLRSQVRGRVLPLLDEVLGPKMTETLARTARQLQDDSDVLDHLADQLFAEARVGKALVGQALSRQSLAPEPDARDAGETANLTEVTLALEPLKNAPRALRTRALRMAALVAGVPAGSLNFRHIEEIERLITHWHGQQPISLPGAFSAARVTGRITFQAPNLRDER